jgi:predicted ATPase
LGEIPFEALMKALSPNAALLLELVPELALVIGEQPPVEELPARAAQSRFQLVVRCFISVFARPEHPLALFLDDLQWLDAATLDLLEDLLTSGEVRHLLLVGAYRDNEVTEAHPLTQKLAALAEAGPLVRTLTLPPLGQSDLALLLADALHTTPDRIAGLTELVQGKTGGNPFFVNQFLSSLVEEGLLGFDHGQAQWSWDRERTLAKGYSDKVVDLMLRKLARFPPAAQQTLQLLACLGSAAESAVLCAVLERSAEEVEAELWEPLQQELHQGELSVATALPHGARFQFTLRATTPST